jgi:hypothetical protein
MSDPRHCTGYCGVMADGPHGVLSSWLPKQHVTTICLVAGSQEQGRCSRRVPCPRKSVFR